MQFLISLLNLYKYQLFQVFLKYSGQFFWYITRSHFYNHDLGHQLLNKQIAFKGLTSYLKYCKNPNLNSIPKEKILNMKF